ncbi:hypothetical protein PO909_032516 [Leuciscus waleckii]
MGDTVTKTRYRGPPRADQPNPAFSEEDIFVGNLNDTALLRVSDTPTALPQSILLEVCERMAARLNIEWPAPQSATDQERDIYDGKVLGPPPSPRKQLFPILPACAKHTRHNWNDPLDLKHGLTGLEVEILDELGQQLEKGTPSLPLWKEILTVNDLVLRNGRHAVQACGRSMALSVAVERALWLNLSGLPDSEKRRIAGAPVEANEFVRERKSL